VKSRSREERLSSSTPRLLDSSTLVDLHTHSTFSDGLLSPTALVEEAASRGVRTLALTDHDTVAGIPEARAAGERLGVEIIPGVELSTSLTGGEGVHLLGYLIDTDNPNLLQGLAAYAEARAERMTRMIERLSRVGAPVDADQVRAIAGHGTVGRPHLARALIAAGHASDVPDAFDRFLGWGKPAYVPRPRVDPRDAIALVRAAGGVAVLAHPFSPGGVESVLDSLVPAGLGGMEVDYGQYSAEEREVLREIATRRGLIATGGSDFHGPDMRAGRELGMVSASSGAVAALREVAACPHPLAPSPVEPGEGERARE
jgi:predicted metal-dependent phosphoesterase TrpH